MAYTPGPWTLDEDENICAGADNHLLAYVVPDPTWGIDAHANAALIAAAPDLLAACELPAGELRQPGPECLRETANIVALCGHKMRAAWLRAKADADEAAIRKARGDA